MRYLLLPVLFFSSFLVPQVFAQSADGGRATGASEIRGMSPRSSASDYQAQAQTGKVTIAADFTGHSVPKPEGPLSTEDHVVVEVGIFGPAGEKTTLSIENFSLRINGKKNSLSSSPWGLVAKSIKDPQWAPPEEADSKSKSKGGLSTGGGGQDQGSMPVIVHVPIELRHAMAQYVEKTSLPEGERALPQAGLIYFPYRGKVESIHSMELIYEGPAGKASLNLQP
jgi:hypothetical protein